jgi:hypothetical protein
MADVIIRPDLKTAGGEVNDILWNNRYIGTMTLVYREADRISGAIQLEQTTLPHHAKEQVTAYLQHHIQSLIDAMSMETCDVLVTYSEYDHIIATDRWDSSAENVEEDYDFDYDWMDNERFEDEGPLEQDEYRMDASLDDDDDIEPVSEAFIGTGQWGMHELVVIAESRNKAEYHIYDPEKELLAEAELHINGREISGTVHWLLEPSDDEIETAADLLVSDFNDDEVDTFIIHMEWEQDIIETIELTHEDLLDEEDAMLFEDEVEPTFNREDYTVVLARDDGDTLTYEF